MKGISSKTGCLVALVTIVIIIIVLIVVMNNLAYTNKTNYTSVPNPNLSPFEQSIEKALGRSNLESVSTRLQSLTFDNGTAYVEFVANDNLSDDLRRTGIYDDIWEIMKLVFDNKPEVQTAVVMPFSPLEDKYGEVSIGKIGSLILRRSEYEKIDQSNFTALQLKDIAQGIIR